MHAGGGVTMHRSDIQRKHVKAIFGGSDTTRVPGAGVSLSAGGPCADPGPCHGAEQLTAH